MSSRRKGMCLGAVAILDCLGFKGIWRRHDVSLLVARLQHLRNRGYQLQGGRARDGVLVSDSGLCHQVQWMSDTLVITVTLRDRGPGETRMTYKALKSAATIAADIVMEGLLAEPRLLMRGCLAVGEMRTHSSFLVGPAIDDAAEWFGQADGPFVWLAPSALDINDRYGETFFDRLAPYLMSRYSVPLRSGSRVNTLAFNFYGATWPNETFWRVKNAVMAELSAGGAPTASKRRNMAKFFRSIDHERISGKWKNEALKYRKANSSDLTRRQTFALILLETGASVADVSAIMSRPRRARVWPRDARGRFLARDPQGRRTAADATDAQ